MPIELERLGEGLAVESGRAPQRRAGEDDVGGTGARRVARIGASGGRALVPARDGRGQRAPLRAGPMGCAGSVRASAAGGRVVGAHAHRGRRGAVGAGDVVDLDVRRDREARRLVLSGRVRIFRAE